MKNSEPDGPDRPHEEEHFRGICQSVSMILGKRTNGCSQGGQKGDTQQYTGVGKGFTAGHHRSDHGRTALPGFTWVESWVVWSYLHQTKQAIISGDVQDTYMLHPFFRDVALKASLSGASFTLILSPSSSHQQQIKN